MATFVWGALLVTAVAWPSRAIGWLDGAPFDAVSEALIAAIVLPAIWALHPGFVRSATARAVVAALLVWKIGAWIALPQAGWCGDFLTANPPNTGGFVFGRTWDARTLFEQPLPSCSAIVARPYDRPTRFPAWVVNVAYGRDRKLSTGDFDGEFLENPRPPSGEFVLNVVGALRAPERGSMTLETGADVTMTGTVDDRPIAAARGAAADVPLDAGTHRIALELRLSGRDWRFVPRWNGRNLFSAVGTAVRPVSALQWTALRVAAWIAPALVVTLLGCWIASAFRQLQPDATVLAVVAASAAIAAVATVLGRDTAWARLAVLALAAALAVPVRQSLRNVRGVWLVIAVPWLAIVAALAYDDVGRYTLYRFGDDTLTYQRFAYRIFMQGYWLEGGQATFWNQPLYRWICGVLHVLFGDSSAGETIWDGFGLLVGALFAFRIVDRLAGFRYGIAAAFAVLATVMLGPNWYMVGRGLSEISAALWLYLAAWCLLDARDGSDGSDGSITRAGLAGVFAVLAFYTRLNHLPLVIVLVVLTLAGDVASASLWNVRALWNRLPKAVAATYLGFVMLGVLAFAARTWYYTGDFSLFAGTTRVINGTGLGLGWSSFGSAEAWRRAFESVLMIVTVQDPPRFEWRSVLVVAGVVLSLLALLQVPGARRLPLAVAMVCLASIAGGLVARGIAYPGRFSVHLMPIAIAASVLSVRPT